MTMQSTLRLRPATPDDCRRLWEWANDPLVRAAAFNSALIPWEDHVAWFRRKLSDAGCAIYLVEDESGRPVGQVRFDRGAGGMEADLSIAPSHRGQGYGAQALRAACERLASADDAAEVIAYIKPDNQASLRTFTRAGFLSRGAARVKGHEALMMVWSRS